LALDERHDLWEGIRRVRSEREEREDWVKVE
jgi:hypothetical protein